VGLEPEVSTAVRVLSKRREGKVPLAKSVCFGVQAMRVEEIRLSYSSESEVKESREALPRSFYILTLGAW